MSSNIAIPVRANAISSASFIFKVTADNLSGHYFWGFEGEWLESADDDTRFSNFDGWHSGTTLYDGTPLFPNKDSFETGGGVDSVVFEPAGREYLRQLLIDGADTSRIVFSAGRDYSGNAPAGNDFLILDGTFDPYIRITFALLDSIPNNFTMTPIAGEPDSMLVEFADRTYTETEFAIVNAYGDTLAIVAADGTTARIGGLLPNTLYTWRVKVTGGSLDGLYSDYKQGYTLPAVPQSPSITATIDSVVTVALDTTGLKNPSFTKYALRNNDTNRWVQNTGTANDTLGGYIYGTSEDWKTLAVWGNAPVIYLRYAGGDSSLIGSTTSWSWDAISGP